MDAPPKGIHDSELLWPDATEGPYRVRVRFHRGEQELIPIGLIAEHTSRRNRLEPALLRALPQIIEQAAAALRLKLVQQALPAAPTEPLSHLDSLERLLARRRAEEALEAACPHRPGRPRSSLGELQAAATIYFRAFRRGQDPIRTVATTLKISHAAAASRIARARTLGILGPVRKGEAGGGLLLRRGDAKSLAAEIARLKIGEARRAGRAGERSGPWPGQVAFWSAWQAGEAARPPQPPQE
jgi:hypothetical protein